MVQDGPKARRVISAWRYPGVTKPRAAAVFAAMRREYDEYSKNRNNNKIHINTMIITSPSFAEGDTIPRKFTCEGGDINPELQIQNVPPGTGSLALVVHDPDAPIEGGFTHWVVWNINPGTVLIKEESVPPGAMEGKNGAGRIGYMGPCPPPGGPHRYEFRLYAVSESLGLPEGSSVDDLMESMEGKVVDKALLTGLYSKE